MKVQRFPWLWFLLSVKSAKVENTLSEDWDFSAWQQKISMRLTTWPAFVDIDIQVVPAAHGKLLFASNSILLPWLNSYKLFEIMQGLISEFKNNYTNYSKLFQG